MLVTAPRIDESAVGASKISADDLEEKRTFTSDSAQLLQDLPGISLYGAGGISSLPAIRGLADDRVRIQVDGMDVAAACPNHMNSALSYINPTRVDSVTVFAGIAPVSAGGDSLGGTIQVDSAPPQFADEGGELVRNGRAGTFYRSNGEARGYNVDLALAGRTVSLTYDESHAQADNYTAGGAFKAPGVGGLVSGEWLDGDVVGSSAYRDSRNREIGVALRSGGHLLQVQAGQQKVGFEGFPNQRMDMTSNDNTLVNVRYTGQYSWGELRARLYDQDTRHEMDMGPDRFSYGFGMPMNSRATTRGGSVTGTINLTEDGLLRLGTEYQALDLDDWWPPVGSSGSMCCDPFWNIRDGERDRFGFFAEWDARWSDQWSGLLGVRSDTVRSDAGEVAGYNTDGIYAGDAAAFNAADRRQTSHHLDVTALLRRTQDAMLTIEGGYARKTRSPGLYERYPWSTLAMTALMNNFVGDGNGYIGKPNLKPEVADTLSVTGDWHDARQDRWELKATGYLTYVDDFIDARRCDFGQCAAANATRTDGFVFLQYENQSARLYGLELSGYRLLGQSSRIGSVTVRGMLNFIRGENRRTGYDLYHIMPLDSVFTLEHKFRGLTSTAEVQVVAAKDKVSQVRNEVTTSGYGLLNLRSSYEWKWLRLDVGIENVFDRFYSLPLGGAYLGQGASMSTNTIPWGVTVPRMGRSVGAGLTVGF
ncbi:MAG: TonB-dependent receptor [Gammaproteobacteria bacterium]